MASNDPIIIGIDLGTTNTCVAMSHRTADGRVFYDAVENREGKTTTPSMVSFSNGEALIGQSAKGQLPSNPQNTVYSAKRLMGRRASDPELQTLFRNAQFRIDGDNNGHPRILINNAGNIQYIYPEEITALVLGEVKETIKMKTGRLPDHCIITVPAHFDELQRDAIRDAAAIAQLPLTTLVSEPTAAVVAFQHFCQFDEGTVLVYDFGGGNLDVSIVQVQDDRYVVKAVSGDRALGGDDIDNLIVDEMVKRFMGKNPGNDPRRNPGSMAILKAKAEEAKIQLSSSNTSNILIPNFVGGLPLNETLTRAQFEFLCEDIFSKLTDCIDIALEDALISRDDITHIILVGGSSYIPQVRVIVSEYFEDRIRPLNAVSPETAIAVGAAILCDKKVKGQESVSQPPHPPSGAAQEEGNDPNDGDIEIVDVQSCSIGIRSHTGNGDRFQKYIYRNRPLPQENSFTFRTTRDNQTVANIDVLIGEEDVVDWDRQTHNRIAQFTITGLPPKPRGQVLIEVTMRVDETGIIHVSAKYKEDGSDVSNECQIDSNKVFNNDKIEEAISNQQQIFDYKAKRNEYLELLNEFRTLIAEFRAKHGESESKVWEQYLNNFTDNIPTNIERIEQALRNLRTTIEAIKVKI